MIVTFGRAGATIGGDRDLLRSVSRQERLFSSGVIAGVAIRCSTQVLGRQLYAGRHIQPPLFDPLSIQRQQSDKCCHLPCISTHQDWHKPPRMQLTDCKQHFLLCWQQSDKFSSTSEESIDLDDSPAGRSPARQQVQHKRRSCAQPALWRRLPNRTPPPLQHHIWSIGSSDLQEASETQG